MFNYKKMINGIDFHNFLVDVEDSGEIKVTNQSDRKCRLSFFDPKEGFYGYSNLNFKPNFWSKTKPNEWYSNIIEKIHIILSFDDHRKILQYDFKNNKFDDISDPYHKFVNYEEIKKEISVVIPAYKTQDYIDETIENFLNISSKKTYLNLKILIGIDGCKEVFKHISKRVYPENVSVYLSEKNYGESIMKNSLIYYCETEKIIVIDSDDIPMEKMVDKLWEELETYDFVHYKSMNFLDGNDYKDENNLKESNSVWGGTFACKKSVFLNLNGWFPWRVQADDEFLHRVRRNINKEKLLSLEEPLFYYRKRENSKSRSKDTNKDSFVRICYRDLISQKIMKGKFDNPERFYYNKLTLIQ